MNKGSMLAWMRLLRFLMLIIGFPKAKTKLINMDLHRMVLDSLKMRFLSDMLC